MKQSTQKHNTVQRSRTVHSPLHYKIFNVSAVNAKIFQLGCTTILGSTKKYMLKFLTKCDFSNNHAVSKMVERWV